MTRSVKVESIQHLFDPRLQIGQGNHPSIDKNRTWMFENGNSSLSLKFNNEVWCPSLRRILGEDGPKTVGSTWVHGLSLSSYYNKHGKYPDIALFISGSVIDSHMGWKKIHRLQPHLRMRADGELFFHGGPKHFSPIGVTYLVNKHIDELIDPFFWQEKANRQFMWNEAVFVLTPKEFQIAKTGDIG